MYSDSFVILGKGSGPGIGNFPVRNWEKCCFFLVGKGLFTGPKEGKNEFVVELPSFKNIIEIKNLAVLLNHMKYELFYTINVRLDFYQLYL